MDSFDSAFEIVVGIEAGYVNDPKDPGGETKFGISKRAHPDLDIRNLTLDQAKLIYKSGYWDALGLDGLSWKWQLSLFDCAINQGTHFALTELQADLDYSEFLDQRLQRYWTDQDFPRFGLGWVRRLLKIALLAEVPPPQGDPSGSQQS